MKISLKRRSNSDVTFDIVCFIILTFLALITLYPLYFIVIASFSDPASVNSGQVWVWFKNFTVDGYRQVLSDINILRGYMNSIVYTTLGTLVSVSLTLSVGYSLSRKDMYGRKVIMLLFLFTMFFSGGIIPKYTLVANLGWIDSMWSMIIPDALSVFNIIIAKTFFNTTIPDELLEASIVDGCKDFRFFFRIALPLSKSLIAIMVLFYAVGSWNSWFNGMLYLQDNARYTLNLILRDILIQVNVNTSNMNIASLENMLAQQRIAELVKYVVIVVSSVPVLAIYPLIQKHFVKGVLIGSVKE